MEMSDQTTPPPNASCFQQIAVFKNTEIYYLQTLVISINI